MPSADNGRTRTPGRAAFFERTDWRGFVMTVIIALSVYLFTLAPEVTLEFSGELSTAARYAGVAHPPGHPVWSVYAWLFTTLIQFSNIAWRVGVSSVVAAALSCGLIALMVCRSGAMMLEGTCADGELRPGEARWLRLVCGCVAGLGFGFSNSVWGRAVVADTWPICLLLMAVVLCLMMRWLHAPEKRLALGAACFVYGLAVVGNQSLAIAAPGLLALVAIGDLTLGRDSMCAMALVVAGVLTTWAMGLLPDVVAIVTRLGTLWRVDAIAAIAVLTAGVALAVITRRIFTRWKTVVLAVVCLSLGLAACLYVAIASMTSPPTNWGYARAPDGFAHVLSRGQYESIRPTESLARFGQHVVIYWVMAKHDLGLAYLIAALIPFGFLHRMRPTDRGWMLGLLGLYLLLSLGILAMLNVGTDRQSRELNEVYFTPAHLVLAIWAGCGLVLLGARVCRPSRPTPPT